jgi:hypothetical protein
MSADRTCDGESHALTQPLSEPHLPADARGTVRAHGERSSRRTARRRAARPEPPLAICAAVVDEDVRQPSTGEVRNAVVISRVEDPQRLLDESCSRIQGDVVEALVDLVVALLEGEDGNAEAPGG